MRTQIMIFLGLLLGYAALTMGLSPIGSDPLSLDGNVVGFIDRLVFSPAHLYTPKFDPEGLLSTLPAIASGLLGNIIGYVLISTRSPRQKLIWMTIGGVVLATLGWIWNDSLPLNKALWSSSYVLWTGGASNAGNGIAICHY